MSSPLAILDNQKMMELPSASTLNAAIRYKDKAYIDLAKYIAKNFSKCIRAQYGTVWLNKEGHLIGASWNGKPKGVGCDSVCFRNGQPPHHACCLHAEDNGASWTSPVDRVGGVVYVSGTPCDMCYLRLLNTGVSELVYLVESDCKHICNIITPDSEFVKHYNNQVQVIPFTYEEWNRLYENVSD